jgi:RNA polymerase sigma-70 factor, ECF subfamily
MQTTTQFEEIATTERRYANQQEFEGAVEECRPRIFRFLLASMHDLDTAEVLTQECLLKAHRSWSSFRGDASVATWLTRIAINLQRDHWRNRRLQFWRETCRNAVDLEDARDWLRANQPSPEDQLLVREQVGHVWNAVDSLTERQRAVFLLRFVDDLPYHEIAQATGLKKGTVKAHISRALHKVRMQLRSKPCVRRRSFAQEGSLREPLCSSTSASS